jgi:hypothetical protein
VRQPKDDTILLGYDDKGRERILGADGYVHLKVGSDHPMAHKNGWAREHRVMMSERLGRVLKPSEVVHHKNDERTDNRIGNFELKGAGVHTGEHKHRKGTGKPTCGKGHPWTIYPSGRRRCRVCENAADRSRYHVNKK